MSDEPNITRSQLKHILQEHEAVLLVKLRMDTPEAIQETEDARELAKRVNRTATFLGRTFLQKIAGAGAMMLIGYALAKAGITLPDNLLGGG